MEALFHPCSAFHALTLKLHLAGWSHRNILLALLPVSSVL